MNLGNTYRALGERLSGKDAEDSLRAAVSANQNALQIHFKESPAWAMAQHNLGMVYGLLGERQVGGDELAVARAESTSLRIVTGTDELHRAIASSLSIS